MRIEFPPGPDADWSLDFEKYCCIVFLPIGSLANVGSDGSLGGPHPAAFIAITRNKY